ncbi:hypothetical protein C0995_015285, partial [Termitomyces sp. Mi166
MERNCNPWFVVWHRLPAGQRPGPGLTGNAPVAKESWYMPGAGQPGPKGAWDSPSREKLVDDKEAPPEVEELEGDDNAESVHIDGDKYIAVDVYDNEYYAYDDKEEHLFALTEHQGDKHYTPQEKECLVIYVEVNGHPAWTLWDSGSTTTGITPQFAHVNAIHVYELTEPLMLQLGTVGSYAVVQFSVEVKIKMSEHLTKEYVDIANFDCYDMII